MSDNKNKSTATVGRITGKGFLQGRIFSLEFFKRNWVYVVFVMAMALAYIGNKFACQSSLQQLIALKTDLANAQTDLVKASADYNSMIRESEMVKRMRSRNLGLTAPLDPPYELKSK